MAMPRSTTGGHAGVPHRVLAERLLCCGSPFTSTSGCRQGPQTRQHERNNINLKLSATFGIKKRLQTSPGTTLTLLYNISVSTSHWISKLIRYLESVIMLCLREQKISCTSNTFLTDIVCIYCYCLHFKWFSLYCGLHVTHSLFGLLLALKSPFSMRCLQSNNVHIMKIREIVCD